MNPLTVGAPGSVELRALRSGAAYSMRLHLKSPALKALYGQ
jgi:hypothetical protein